MSDVRDLAIGKWPGILSALGVGQEFLRNKHGPCPACGGKDRYRFSNREGRGTFYCSGCGHGDGFDLLVKLKGYSFPDACREVERIVGTVPASEPIRIKSDAECRAAMQKRWRSCAPLGGPAMAYLERRLGQRIESKVLRSARNRPAMVALMQAPSGRATMVHETLLTESGQTAPTDKPKLMMHGTIEDGAAVRLVEAGPVLGIAEGIETALSAWILTGTPCWAALNEVCLRKWEPPAGTERVVIFGDNDANFVGQAAAYHLAKRLALQKKPIPVSVSIPDTVGWDWNDVLNKFAKA